MSILTEKMIVEYCAPTLAGIKAGCIFSVRTADRSGLFRDLRTLNGVFQGKGVRVMPLRHRDGLAMIYVWRPSLLKRDLGDDCARCILEDIGYDLSSCSAMLSRLMSRLAKGDGFPHEIGLFLGYPPGDVLGFMNRGRCKCTGCWKVYTDVEAAQTAFAKIKECRSTLMSRLAAGLTLDRLAISEEA
jgi:hypothetical protein